MEYIDEGADKLEPNANSSTDARETGGGRPNILMTAAPNPMPSAEQGMGGEHTDPGA